MDVTLYSTNCINCKMLEKKLNLKNIPHQIVTDIKLMQQLGFSSAPMLEVDGNILNFHDANKWVDEQEVFIEY